MTSMILPKWQAWNLTLFWNNTINIPSSVYYWMHFLSHFTYPLLVWIYHSFTNNNKLLRLRQRQKSFLINYWKQTILYHFTIEFWEYWLPDNILLEIGQSSMPQMLEVINVINLEFLRSLSTKCWIPAKKLVTCRICIFHYFKTKFYRIILKSYLFTYMFMFSYFQAWIHGSFEHLWWKLLWKRLLT